VDVVIKESQTMLQFSSAVSRTLRGMWNISDTNKMPVPFENETNPNLKNLWKHLVNMEMNIRKQHIGFENIVRTDVVRSFDQSRMLFTNKMKSSEADYRNLMKEIVKAETHVKECRKRYGNAHQDCMDLHDKMISLKTSYATGEKNKSLMTQVKSKLRIYRERETDFLNARKNLENVCNRDSLNACLSRLQDELERFCESIVSALMRARMALYARDTQTEQIVKVLMYGYFARCKFSTFMNEKKDAQVFSRQLTESLNISMEYWKSCINSLQSYETICNVATNSDKFELRSSRLSQVWDAFLKHLAQRRDSIRVALASLEPHTRIMKSMSDAVLSQELEIRRLVMVKSKIQALTLSCKKSKETMTSLTRELEKINIAIENAVKTTTTVSPEKTTKTTTREKRIGSIGVLLADQFNQLKDKAISAFDTPPSRLKNRRKHIEREIHSAKSALERDSSLLKCQIEELQAMQSATRKEYVVLDENRLRVLKKGLENYLKMVSMIFSSEDRGITEGFDVVKEKKNDIVRISKVCLESSDPFDDDIENLLNSDVKILEKSCTNVITTKDSSNVVKRKHRRSNSDPLHATASMLLQEKKQEGEVCTMVFQTGPIGIKFRRKMKNDEGSKEEKEEVIVHGVSPNTQADKLGIKVESVLVKINDQNCDIMDFKSCIKTIRESSFPISLTFRCSPPQRLSPRKRKTSEIKSKVLRAAAEATGLGGSVDAVDDLLDDDDVVNKSYACALMSKNHFPYQGRIYLATSSVVFHTPLYKKVSPLLFRSGDIQSVVKKMTGTSFFFL